MSYRAHKIIDNLYQGGMPPPGRGLKDAGVDVIIHNDEDISTLVMRARRALDRVRSLVTKVP